MKRREYGIDIVVNRRRITKVIVDSHYEKKHSATVDDQIILKLVQTLDGEVIEPDAEDPPYSYFSQDRIELDGKFYKLIWLLEDDELYVGVANAYRR
jgi:hypothetical protein